jgi:hypothetical protein
VGHRQKVFDDGEGMIRQGDRAQANYRRSETLPFRLFPSTNLSLFPLSPGRSEPPVAGVGRRKMR